jgi:hypothetical protein
MMDYRIVFDIATAGYKNWDFPAEGLILVGVGAVLVCFRTKLPGWWGKHPPARNVFAFYFFGFSVVWTMMAFVSTYHDYASLAAAEASNRVSVVQGVVTNFKPMQAQGTRWSPSALLTSALHILTTSSLPASITRICMADPFERACKCALRLSAIPSSS